MKKIAFTIGLIVSALVSYSAFSQNKDSVILKKVYDADHDETYCVGEYTDVRYLQLEPGFELIAHPTSMAELASKSDQIQELKGLMTGVHAVMAIGTWCGDSQSWGPDIINVLTAADVDSKNIKVYALDRDKKGLNGEEVTYNVQYVPTVIFYKGDQEIGRFVESPENSILEDFITLLKK